MLTRQNRYVINSDTKDKDNDILNIMWPLPSSGPPVIVICSCLPTNLPPLRGHFLGWNPILCGETFEREFPIIVSYRINVVEL
jgi:hypothetical protein